MLDNPMVEFDRSKNIGLGENDNLIEQVLKSNLTINLVGGITGKRSKTVYFV
jgi:hypothetical protein